MTTSNDEVHQVRAVPAGAWVRLREIDANLYVALVVDYLAVIPGQSIQEEGVMQPTESVGFTELLGALRDGNV